MASNGGHLVVVEDDLARRGDPHLEGVAFVGDRAIRWLELGEDPSLVAQLVRTGGSGYPLNAFVCGSGAGDLGLISDRVLSTEAVSVVARSVTTIISSAFDAESYVLLAVEDLWGTNVSEHRHVDEASAAGDRHQCESMDRALADEDVPLDYHGNFREVGLRIMDGGTSFPVLKACPFCGALLPPSLREEWFDHLEALGLEPGSPETPDELHSDAWWRTTCIE